MYGFIRICYACWCLYVVIHALSWIWLCMYSKSNMHCEVILCILGHHDVVGCYDAYVLVEIEQDM